VINVGVVGYGYSGRAFHTYLPGLADGLRLYGITARSQGAQQAAAADHPEARIYGSLEEMLNDDMVQLVVLATPHNTHRDLAIQAMNAGRHVVTDKVMALNAQEAQEMIGAAERNGVMLSVFHNRRWDWDYLTVRKVIEDGLIGEPYLYQAAIMGYGGPRGWRGNKAASGGIMYDWGAHFMDQALQLVPAPVESVYCDLIYRDVWPIDIGNYGLIRMQFANGVRYDIEIGNLCAAPKPRWFVMGDAGTLVKHGLDPQEGPMNQRRIEEAEESPETYARVYTVQDHRRQEQVIPSVRGTWKSYYQNISDVLNKGAELIVKPEQVLQVMRVYDAAMESARTGTVVRL
jgi:scyllo-inositol 2-dehydrogenase (NADP+)